MLATARLSENLTKRPKSDLEEEQRSWTGPPDKVSDKNKPTAVLLLPEA